MGKTDKEKAKEKEKSAAKAMAKGKAPRALKPKAGAPKKKKWSSSKQKEKLNNAVFWTKNAHDKLIKDIISKEPYVTPSLVSSKLKINVSCAREALKELREEEQIVPSTEYNAKYCCFVRGPKFVAHVDEKKKDGSAAGGDKKGGKGKGPAKADKPKKK